jgi:predicted lipid-binding transport protein (Tim44 family)
MPEGVQQHKGAAGGAAAGAAGGAIIGGVAGGTKGAIIGGLLGALAGGAVGHYAYDQKRSQAQTNQAYAYTDPNASVRVESVSIAPKTVRRGERVDLNYSYAVLTTSQAPVAVREVREIYQGSMLWSAPEVEVQRAGGTYQSSVPVMIPNDAKPGTYKVKFIAQTGNTKDAREATFTVR